MKLNIYLRQTSHNNLRSPRPEWMDYERCFKNLLDTINWDICNLTIVFDGEIKGHFTNKYSNKYNFKVIQTKTSHNDTATKSGWNNASQTICESIIEDKISDSDVIYMVDNDYLHLPYWSEITLDLFKKLGDNRIIVSLYDHLDKYIFNHSEEDIKKYNIENHWGLYRDLKSQVIISNYRHWRTVPSICQSWVINGKLFRDNFDIFSQGLADNTSCGIFGERGYMMLSPIPSLSTHLSVPFLSPFIDWKSIMDNTILIS